MFVKKKCKNLQQLFLFAQETKGTNWTHKVNPCEPMGQENEKRNKSENETSESFLKKLMLYIIASLNMIMNRN